MDTQEDDEMLVPHTDFAVEGPQPMEVPQSESASTAENQAAEDPQTLRFTCTIENFSRLNVKKHYSDVFTVGGYKWRVLIFPKGNNVDNLSMYLDVADSTTLPYGWSRYAQFSLAIVNQVHNKYTIRKDTQHQFNARESDWGFTSFMPLSELYDPSRGYLVSDTCVVEAEVAVRRMVDYRAYDSKKETGYVGFKNQGATCYMNSLLQTLYHIPYFRKAVYHMPTTENDMPSGSIPLALRSLFYKLQYSDSSVATKELTKSFGWDTCDSFRQHDVHEFNRVLCEKLEDKMKGTVVEGTIQQLFEGHHMNYLECINVDYESTKKESFYDLQLDVKGCRDVYASFDKYVEVERLEGDNKYQAEQHGLQDAKKYVLFIDFPPVLQLQLKRFEYGDTMVKINDRYEFPLQLDLDRENGKYLSPNADRKVRNLYTLHSVLVHSGGEHGGHYYAFIRPTLSDQWFKFDDERVTKEDMKWALEEQYGGEEELPQTNPGFNNTPFKFTKYSNAYMLVYIRESDKEKIMDEKDIAEHRRIRLKREQEEKEHKKEEKAEAHLYTIIKIPEEEKNLGSQDRLIHVYHFTKDTTQNQMQVQNFGEPFFLIIHEGETLSEVRVRIQKKLQVPDDEFSKCLCENSVMASHNDDVDIDIEVLGSNTPVTNDNTINSTTGDCSIATSVKPKKGGYPLKSHVWQHFTRDPKTKGDDLMAICKYCYGRYKAASKSGTSTLSRHLTRCTAYSVKDKSQKVLTFGSVKKEDGDEGVRAGFVPYSFNMEHAQRELAIMIVMLELPFSIVDRAPFRRFVKCINPRFQFISCTTVRREFLKIYHLEKAKLKSFLSTSCKHISLTSDLWTSNQTLGYLSVTAHFVDNNWKLHKKILSFCMVPAPHTGVIIANMIERSLMEYDIKKICTITLDNATNNKSAVDNLVETLSRKGILLQRGKFFHIKCAAHVVNLIVQDGLSEIKSSVEAIRTCVKYVRSSQSRKQEFESCVLQENISSSKGLCLDVCTRWNSTYLMLASALPYESAFVRMKTRDPIYAKDVAPTFDDWRKAETISKLLKVFYNATKVLSGTKYITANLVFHEVYEIQAHLLEMLKSDDSCISLMANKMHQKFDKYWKKCNILFAIALVLDPRYKLEYVEFMYHELYSYSDADEYTQVLRKEMVALFNEYTSFSSSLQKQVVTSTSTEMMNDTSTDSKKEQLRKSFLRKGAGKNNVDLKTELEQYYEEKICPDDPNLDILSWWKVNSSKFPILSTMARDILAIQVSTVASESAFSTGSRVINQYRSSLSPGVIQALVCTQDWLRDAITDDVVEGEPEIYDHEDDTDRIESGVTEVEESEM